MENKSPNMKLNFISTVVFQVVSVLLSFITAPYVSRVLKIDGIGIYSYTSSVQSYFLLIAALGTATYGAREISRVRDSKEKYSKLFWEIEGLTIITTGLCIIAWLVFSMFSVKYEIYYYLLLPSLFATMLDISWFFNGLEKISLVLSRNVSIRFIGIILTFILVKTKSDLPTYFIIQSCTPLCANVLMWLELPKILGKCQFKSLRPLSHLKSTFMYFVPTIASSIYLLLDKVLIGVITNDVAENGYYTQAERVINILKNVVFMAINSVVGVRISYLYEMKKMDEIKNRIEYSFNYLAFTGFGCVFGIWAVSSMFIPLFYGEGYEKSIIILNLFAPILLCCSVSSCLNAQYYVPVGRRAECTKYIVVGAIVNVILNLLLISRFASIGAVIASVIAEGVIGILFWHNSNNIISLKSIYKLSWRKIISGAVMMFLIMLINSMFSANVSAVLLLADILIGFCSYIGVLLLLNDKWTKNIIIFFLQKVKICQKKY